MRARPSRHTRTIRTKRGMKTIMVNPNIKKRTAKRKAGFAKEKLSTWYDTKGELHGSRMGKPDATEDDYRERTAEHMLFTGGPGYTSRDEPIEFNQDLEVYRKRQIQKDIRRKLKSDEYYDDDDDDDYDLLYDDEDDE